MVKKAEESKSNNKNLLIIVVAAIAVVAIVVVAIVLATSGVFGKKTVVLNSGINQIEPGSYTCISTSGDEDESISAYISDTGKYKDGESVSVYFHTDSETNIVVDEGKRIGISESGASVVCTRK